MVTLLRRLLGGGVQGFLFSAGRGDRHTIGLGWSSGKSAESPAIGIGGAGGVGITMADHGRTVGEK